MYPSYMHTSVLTSMHFFSDKVYFVLFLFCIIVLLLLLHQPSRPCQSTTMTHILASNVGHVRQTTNIPTKLSQPHRPQTINQYTQFKLIPQKVNLILHQARKLDYLISIQSFSLSYKMAICCMLTSRRVTLLSVGRVRSSEDKAIPLWVALPCHDWDLDDEKNAHDLSSPCLPHPEIFIIISAHDSTTSCIRKRYHPQLLTLGTFSYLII